MTRTYQTVPAGAGPLPHLRLLQSLTVMENTAEPIEYNLARFSAMGSHTIRFKKYTVIQQRPYQRSFFDFLILTLLVH
jgi:hypothetical protein